MNFCFSHERRVKATPSLKLLRQSCQCEGLQNILSWVRSLNVKPKNKSKCVPEVLVPSSVHPVWRCLRVRCPLRPPALCCPRGLPSSSSPPMLPPPSPSNPPPLSSPALQCPHLHIRTETAAPSPPFAPLRRNALSSLLHGSQATTLLVEGFDPDLQALGELSLSSANLLHGNMSYAHKLFEQIFEPDLFMWNLTIGVASPGSMSSDAIFLYIQMVDWKSEASPRR